MISYYITYIYIYIYTHAMCQVHAIEIDPFVVKFGERFRNKSMCGRQITTHVGPAMEKLQTLAQEVRAGKLEPFDFVVIDADKVL